MGKSKSLKKDLIEKRFESISVPPEIRDSLKNLGFTDYFINIYIGLLQHGEMNAHELSKLTKVPYSRIYEVLNEMVRMEVLTKIDGRPSTFVANDPSEVLQRVKQRMAETFEEHITQSLSFLNKLFSGKGQTKNVQFTLHEGNQACSDHLRNVINATAIQLKLAMSNFDILFPIIKNNLDFMHTKGVEVLILVASEFKAHEAIEILKKFAEIKYLDTLPQTLLISDEKVALQSIQGHFDLAHPSQITSVIFNSTNPIFVQYLQELFTRLWDLADSD